MEILNRGAISEIVNSNSRDPFTILGMHKEQKGISIRTFQPDAVSVKVCNQGSGNVIDEMSLIDNAGMFVLHLPKRKKFFRYELLVTYENGHNSIVIDPYSFLPVMSDNNRYLFNQGNLQLLYEDLGSHLFVEDEVAGTLFAVWAPNATRVSVVGEFNCWDGRRHQMRFLGSSGVWELFVPGISEGTVYKYEVKEANGDNLVLKTDPCGYSQEPFPHHGTIVTNLDAFEWDDEAWLIERRSTDLLKRPMNIYELHLGSWRKTGPKEDGDYLTYRDIAEQLAEYIHEMGYTHVELMPVQEHPFVPSWGYQVGGFYAVNYRFGKPQDFQYFVNYMHKNGIAIILDWVSGHFPKDVYGLASFDGSFLYEHSDPREGKHCDWGTLIFNYGRHEVRNFLSSNALFWLDKFHIDGLRVDAVASMLYRNYSRKNGEWIPNRNGGAENLEAVEFLQSVNSLIHDKYPGVITIAEESTAWPLVSRPTSIGGLGFTYKWNMGWMHDTLTYFSKDPIYRKHHHDQIMFGLWYAFNENFILVLSHDEVVHGKKSLLEKMPGNIWEKFANLRALYSFMYSHPGKKLLFMGGEFGMQNEWFEKRSIDWHLLEYGDNIDYHQGIQKMLSDISYIYQNEPALWEQDFVQDGFKWISVDDEANCVLAYIRIGCDWHNVILVVCNFTSVPHSNYCVGVPHRGYWKEIFNSDAVEYGGSGDGNLGGVVAGLGQWHGWDQSLNLRLPPMSVSMFKWKR